VWAVKKAAMSLINHYWKYEGNIDRKRKIIRMLTIDNEKWSIHWLNTYEIKGWGGFLEENKRIKDWMILMMAATTPASTFMEEVQCFNQDSGELIEIDLGVLPEDFKWKMLDSVYASHPKISRRSKYEPQDLSAVIKGVGLLDLVDYTGEVLPLKARPIFSFKTIHPQPYLHETDPTGTIGRLAWRGGMLPAGSISMLGSTPIHCGMKVIRIFGIVFWFAWPPTKGNIEVWNHNRGLHLTLEWGLDNLDGLQVTAMGSNGEEFEPGTVFAIIAVSECCWADVYYLSDDIAGKVLSIRRWNAVCKRKWKEDGRAWEEEDPGSKKYHIEMAGRLCRSTWFDFDP
jgi:hypothetical protein